VSKPELPPALLIQNLPGRETVAAGVWVTRGSAHEPEELAGATHLVEHLTLRRCGGRDRRVMAALVDRLGGDVDAWTGTEMMGVSMATTVDSLGDGLELLVDAIAAPSFEPEDVELERRVILAELELIHDDPSELVEEALLRAAWGGHPLARPVIGSAESVASMDVATLRRHHAELIRSGRLIVALAGDLDGNGALACLERLDLSVVPHRPRLPALEWSADRETVTRTWADQVHTRIGFEAIPSGDDRLAELSVLNRVLGNGSSSRLFQRLREGEGLTYDIWSGLALRRPGGLLEIGWACAPEVNHEVWRLVLDEVERLPLDLNPDEVEVAQEGMLRGLLMDSDQPMARCAMDVAEVLDRGRRFDLGRVREELEAVTIEGVRELAETILRPDRMAAALCGPEGAELPG
jgi:predicted Zn-dependent peptidase